MFGENLNDSFKAFVVLDFFFLSFDTKSRVLKIQKQDPMRG